MSTPATTAFLNAYCHDMRNVAVLVEIDLTPAVVVPPVSIFCSHREIKTPVGSSMSEMMWEDLLIDIETISAPGTLLSTDIALCTGGLKLKNRRIGSQTGDNSRVSDLLATHFWDSSAVVKIWLWVPGLTSFDDALQIFQGSITQAKPTRSRLEVWLTQDVAWNSPVPRTPFTLANYPNAPELVYGQFPPIWYGDQSAPDMRAPWPASLWVTDYQDAAGGKAAVPGIIVNNGVGADKVKAIFAGHAMKNLAARAGKYQMFINDGGKLNPLDATGITTSVIGPSESSASIADETFLAYAHLPPVDVRVSGNHSVNTALNAKNAIDLENETNFATLNSATGQNGLQLILPSPSRLGDLVTAEVIVGYSSTATGNMRCYPYNPVDDGSATALLLPNSSGTARTIRGAWPGDWYTADWQFSGFTDATHASNRAVIDLRIDFAPGVTGTVFIYFVALVVKYRPARTVVTDIKTITVSSGPKYDAAGRRVHGSTPGVATFQPGRSIVAVTDPVYAYDGAIFATGQGVFDDVSGTFSGVGFGLLTRPSDIIHHMLATYGSVPLSQFEMGTGVHGSFFEARAVEDANNIKIVAYLDAQDTLRTYLESISGDVLEWFFRSRFDNKWKCVVWRPGMTPTYRTIVPEDILGEDFSAFLMPDTEVVNSLHVKYLYDYSQGQHLRECWIEPGSSDNGPEPGHTLDTTRASQAFDSYGRCGIRVSSIQGRHLRTNGAALSSLRRAFDLRVNPRVKLVFPSHRMPDVERGRVFQMSPLFDSWQPFPKPGSDGSWAGKNMIVAETHQNLGPASFGTQIVAINID